MKLRIQYYSIYQSMISTQPSWIEEGNTWSNMTPIHRFKFEKPEFIENYQIRESKHEIFTRKISKLYQNNLSKDTMVYLAKLWQEWTSYYRVVKTTILGKKRHDGNEL